MLSTICQAGARREHLITSQWLHSCSMLRRLVLSDCICHHSAHLGPKAALPVSGRDLGLLEGAHALSDRIDCRSCLRCLQLAGVLAR